MPFVRKKLYDDVFHLTVKQKNNVKDVGKKLRLNRNTYNPKAFSADVVTLFGMNSINRLVSLG